MDCVGGGGEGGGVEVGEAGCGVVFAGYGVSEGIIEGKGGGRG